MKLKTLFQKLLLCLLAGLVCGQTFLRVADKVLSIPKPIVIGISVLMLIGALLHAVLWHVQEKKSVMPSVRTNAFWIGALRYGIAFDLAMFGFQKIFYMQFMVPLAMLDEPFSSLAKDQWLTWAYFHHSHAFACVIGGSQILGSFLLLFNQTRLLGVITLIPVLLNIIFIDYFYDLDFGVMLHALILFAGVVYLLFLDYKRLVEFFLRHRSEETSYNVNNKLIKGLGRFSIFIIPLILIFIFKLSHKVPLIRGKYRTSEVTVNGKPIHAMPCMDSVLTVVYFDRANECVMEFGDYKRRLFGRFDLTGDQLSMVWHFPPDARTKLFNGTLRKSADGNFALHGVLGKDTLQARLQKTLVREEW